MKLNPQYSIRRIFTLRSIVVMVIAALFVASCGLSGLTPTPVSLRSTDIPYWGSTPRSSEYTKRMLELGIFSCALVPTSPPEQGRVSWRGLTVGVSAFEDVAKTLVTDGVKYGWNRDKGSMSFSRSTPSILDVDACFVGETLSAIHILGGSESAMPFSELTKNYGNPDRVTWANSILERSLIWSEKGLLIVADVDIELANGGMVITGRTSYIILFPPIPRCQLEQSWIFQSLPKTVEPYKGDVGIITTEAEDPWGVEKGLTDCPK
jgi:hypothetical protein